MPDVDATDGGGGGGAAPDMGATDGGGGAAPDAGATGVGGGGCAALDPGLYILDYSRRA